ncbi:hypothetical protein QJ856_gp1032 [Tupanvirus deep ocean]|uniref:Uncharacterized protein n=2 Tax=Tupanvirus TaxID=2094720 RepID=A0AC62A7G4_9VIRU|nr:hypothetical protein QJ856_gp1032 [Tupanvirus deep ocean]QKU33725.1 hypothetical protein [Tupanvirus deep ocean]
MDLYTCCSNAYNDSITSLVEMTMDQNLPLFVHNDSNVILSNLNDDNIAWELQRPFKRQVHTFFNNIYLFYVINNKYYCDINHIITNLITTQKEHQEIHHDFSEYIDKCIWTQSLSGRITRRNLIDFITVGKMATKYDCEFSKYFLLEFVICLMILYVLIYLFFFMIFYYSIVHHYCRYLE